MEIFKHGSKFKAMRKAGGTVIVFVWKWKMSSLETKHQTHLPGHHFPLNHD